MQWNWLKINRKREKEEGEQQSIESIKATNTNISTYYVEKDGYPAAEGTWRPMNRTETSSTAKFLFKKGESVGREMKPSSQEATRLLYKKQKEL